jgi:ATP-dependent RNA helicase DeaD
MSPEPVETFTGMGLRAELVQELTALGYEEPTPIQAVAIPPMLAGRDIVGQAATGTGKTAAFTLPILHRFAESATSAESTSAAAAGSSGVSGASGRRARGPMALVLVPTRELAMQVSQATHRYGRGLAVSVLPVYGGQPIARQLRELERGVDVVVATPGRALDHVRRGTLALGGIEVVVLDEADEMFDMGFAEEIEGLLEAVAGAVATPPQTVLFSATMPARMGAVVKRHLRDPLRIEVGHELAGPGASGPRVRQVAYVVPRSHKPAALGRVLDVEAPAAALVFCRTRLEVDELTESLNGRGYRAEPLHGGMSQEQRERVMERLRGGSADLIVATDVAARGLDIGQLSHVVNYDVPSAPDSYVHRIGRVGRAGRAGVAITLVEPREHRLLKNLERATKQKIAVEKIPTVDDLRARQLESTRATVRDALVAGELERFRVVVESLSDEFDVIEVALAAVKALHEASGSVDDDEEIPDVRPAEPVRDTRSSGPRDRPGGPGRAGAPTKAGRPGGGSARPGESEGDRPARGERRPRTTGAGTTRLFVGVGRSIGIRPQDLVGAIANETTVEARQVGSIHVAERFSLVEVPESSVEEVIAALRATTLRGKRPTVRRDRA